MSTFIIPENRKERIFFHELISGLPEKLQSEARKVISGIQDEAKEKSLRFVHSFEESYDFLMKEIETHIHDKVSIVFYSECVGPGFTELNEFQWEKVKPKTSRTQCSFSHFSQSGVSKLITDQGKISALSIIFKELEDKNWSPLMKLQSTKMGIRFHLEITFECSFV